MKTLITFAALGAGILALSCSHEKSAQKEMPAPIVLPEPPAPPPAVIAPEEKLPVVGREVQRTESIFFDFDKSEIRDDAHQALQSIAIAFLAKPAEATLLVEGNCDERGTRAYNEELGVRRASAARDYLIGLGVPMARISIVSYGEDRPIDLGHDEAAWARNRRADMKLNLEAEVGPVGVR